jgi:hypothetical protein
VVERSPPSDRVLIPAFALDNPAVIKPDKKLGLLFILRNPMSVIHRGYVVRIRVVAASIMRYVAIRGSVSRSVTFKPII